MAGFDDPRSAVEQIAALLRSRDWAALAAHCEHGVFDGRETGRETHPALRGEPTRPFPPAYRYQSHTEADGVATVTVGLEIDEGGGMVQRSFTTFQLVKRDGRWLIRLA